ncbi:MAG: putative oxidoreductase MhqP [Syntrophorhabdaceae bacterium PtaU1.Bin034]|jgi:putative oxidoreductase|nr:MAG: putative oxidoreductase MhqP [Syntrophorhabdaceae bacterium PtaU1.Bin034]
MFKALLRTDSDAAVLVLRLFLAVVFFPHGAQKVLGWWGGHGLEATITAFTTKMHIPLPFAILAIIAEFLGPIGLFFGFLTRIAAFGVGFTMLVAALMVHLKFGFFMNWFGQKAGEGFEYHLLIIAIALALVIKGGGLWSIDRAITKKV